MEESNQSKNDNQGQETISPSSISRRNKTIILVLLSIIYFLNTAVFALLAPFFPQVAKQRHVQQFETGLIFSMYPFLIFLVSPICGIWSASIFNKLFSPLLMMPKMGVTFTLWAGVFFESGCSILFGFLPEIIDHGIFVAFCIFIRAMQGIGAAFSQTASLAMVSSVFPDSVATTTSALEVFGALGFMAGPPLGGFLYQAGGFRLPFIVMGSSMLVIGCVVVYFIPRLPCIANAPPFRLMKQLLVQPRIIIISLGVIVQLLAFGYLDPTLSPHLKPLKLTPPQIGFVFLSLAAGYGVSSPIFGYLSDRYGFRPFIIFGCFAMTVSLLFLGPAPFIHIPLSIGQVVSSLVALGISSAMAGVPFYADMLDGAVSSLANSEESSEQDNDKDDFVIYSVVSGIFGAAISLGQVLGPIVGGSFTTASNVSFEWTSTGVAFAVATVGVLVSLLTIWERRFKTIQSVSNKRIEDVDPGETSPLI